MPAKSKAVWALLLAAAGIATAVALLPNHVSLIQDWTTANPPVSNRTPCQGVEGGPYPSRAPTTVLLPATNRQIRIGYDCYVDDYKVQTELEYRDGTREIIRYRPDRTIVEWTKHYATVNGDLGKVKSHATFALDGTTFMSHEVYRGDGTLERSGRADRDGSYTARFFYEDGVAVERFRKFNRLKQFVSETQYRPDGTQVAGIVVSIDGLELGVTLYAADGRKTATFYRTKIGEKGYVYDTDGTTILLEYANDPMFRVAGQSDHNGRLVQKWDTRFNRRVISFISQDETRMYTQVWRDSEKPVLRRVEERSFVTKELIRTIEMSKDGSKVDKITFEQNDGSKHVDLVDDTGAVVQIDRYDADGKLANSERLANPKPADVTQEALTTPKPIATPPGFRLFGPPLLYDWE